MSKWNLAPRHTAGFGFCRGRLIGVLLAAALLIATAPVSAQEVPAAPAGGLLSGIGKKLAGKPAGTSGSKSTASRFTPAPKRIYAPKMAESLGENAEQKKAYMELFETGLKGFEAEAKKAGLSNDVVPALAFLIQTQWTIYNGGKEVPTGGDEKLIAQLQGAFAGSDVEKASDAEKQTLYEYCVCTATLTLALYQLATQKNDKDALTAVRTAAGGLLKSVIGMEPDKVQITANGLESSSTASSVASAPSTSSSSLGNTAPNARVTFAVPANRQQKTNGGDETVTWSTKRDSGLSIVSSTISNTKPQGLKEDLKFFVFPAQTAKASPDAAFESFWKDTVDGFRNNEQQRAEVKWRSMTYRYYLPSGAVCYVSVAMLQPKNPVDRIFLGIYLLDFGGVYVPIARVFTSLNVETDATWRGVTDSQPLRNNEPSSFENEIRDFINSIRVTGATAPRPIATRDQFVGKWVRSSTTFSSTQYYSTYTGAYVGSTTNSSASVTRYTLNADGSAVYSFQWVLNGQFKSETIRGKWTFEKDRIVIRDPKTGDTRGDRIVFAGTDAKTGKKFFVMSGGIPDKILLTPLFLMQRNEYFEPDTKN